MGTGQLSAQKRHQKLYEQNSDMLKLQMRERYERLHPEAKPYKPRGSKSKGEIIGLHQRNRS